MADDRPVEDAPAATVASRPSGAAPKAPAWFRGDIDGLRAVAILLIIAYHAHLAIFEAGFIGVDVFFVLSGFLITRNLINEVQSTGRVHLGEFWARRVRRLVPALSLVVGLTLIAGYLLVPIYELEALAKAGGASVLYGSNIYFAFDSQSYFAADQSPSPFLHTWSLGVEEQFYLVWPFLVAAAGFIVSRRARSGGARSMVPLRVIFGVVAVLSFALNLVLTSGGSTWAFFGLPARAWEFAGAGLLATLPVERWLRTAAIRTAAWVAGAALLVVAVVVLTEETPYPGAWAVLPVLGTLLLVAAGFEAPGAVTPAVVRVASTKPLQWIGRVSYSWYLWHWPAIVLAEQAWPDNELVAPAAAALSILPAWVSYKFIETPLRVGPLLARSKARTALGGVVLTAAVLTGAVAVWVGTPDDARASTLSASASVPLPPPGASVKERADFDQARYQARVGDLCPDGATETESSAGDRYCIGGDPNGSRTVMLMGDSHAGQWRDLLFQLAKARGIRLVARQHNNCPVFELDASGDEPERKAFCTEQRRGDLRVLEEVGAEHVVLATWSGLVNRIHNDAGESVDVPEAAKLWGAAADALFTELTERGVRIGMLHDVPTQPFNANKCLSKENDVKACERPLAEVLAEAGPMLDAEIAALRKVDGAVSFETRTLVCDTVTCRLEVDGRLTYVDAHHLTEAFIVHVGPTIEKFFDQLVA